MPVEQACNNISTANGTKRERAQMVDVVVIVTTGLDGIEDLITKADLLDVVDVGVGEEEELVGEGDMLLLSAVLRFHCSLTLSYFPSFPLRFYRVSPLA